MDKKKIIQKVDNLLYNQYTDAEKTEWLNRAEAIVQKTVFDPHEEEPEDVPEPYAEMFLHYLEAQIHLHNGEYDRYNAAVLLFNSILSDFSAYYNKHYTPKTEVPRFLF